MEWKAGSFQPRAWMKEAKGQAHKGSQVGPELSSQVLSPGTESIVDRLSGRLTTSGD